MSDASGCANCGLAAGHAGQRFCPACGQGTPAQRIDWPFMLREFEHGVLQMDRGLLYSMRELMARPGRLMRDYLEGRRARQVKPFLLLMVTAAAVVFLGRFLLGGDLMGSAMQAGFEVGGGGQAGARPFFEVLASVEGWINSNFTVLTLLLLPLEAAALRIAFAGRGLNYPEWLVVSAFLTAQTFVVVMLAIVLQRWMPQAQAWSALVALLYNLVSLVQLFPVHRRWTSALRGVAGLSLFVLVQGMIALAITAVLYVRSAQGG